MAFIVFKTKYSEGLKQPAFVPTGILDIDSQGVHSVANYEFVRVAIEFNNYKQVIVSGTASHSTTWVLKKDGTLWGAGCNYYGSQGSGNYDDVKTFTRRLTNVKQIAASEYTTYAVKKDGTLWCCGRNDYGQQGSGNTTVVTTFTQRLTNVSKVVCGGIFTAWAIKNDGTLWGTGNNGIGSQGSGDTTNVTTFTQRLTNVIDVKATPDETWALRADGSLWSCGSNSYGQQGIGNTTTVKTFTKKMENVKDFNLSNEHTWVIKNDGTLWGCGSNSHGQQGSGNTTNVTSFTQRMTNVKQVFCDDRVSWVLKNDGTFWGCGSNSKGQQGNGEEGNNKYVTTFTQRLTNVADASCSGETTWAIKTNKTLWGCGSETYGQQGSGRYSDYYGVKNFTQRLSNVERVACSKVNTWAVVGNESLYSCGNNEKGQQGTGSTDTRINTFAKRNV